MIKINRHLIKLIVFCFCTNLWGQTTNLNYYLSSNYVESVVYDTSGKLWIGTDEGLNMVTDHDQYQFFANISDENGLLNSENYKLENLGNGILAAFSINGLSIFNPETFQFKQVELNSPPVSIYFNPHNQLYWVTTQEAGIVVLDSTFDIKNEFQFDPLNPLSLSSSKFDGTSDNQNIVFKGADAMIASLNGFNVFNAKQQTFKRYYANNNIFTSNEIKAVFKINSSSFLIATSEKFFVFDSSSKTFNSIDFDISDLSEIVQLNSFEYVLSDGSKIKSLTLNDNFEASGQLVYQFESLKSNALKRIKDEVFVFNSNSNEILRYDIKNKKLSKSLTANKVNDITIKNSKIIIGSNFGIDALSIQTNLLEEINYDGLFFYENQAGQEVKVSNLHVEIVSDVKVKKIRIPSNIAIDKKTLFEINENYLFIMEGNLHVLDLNSGTFIKNITSQKDYFEGTVDAIKLIDNFLFLSTGNGVLRLNVQKTEDLKKSIRNNIQEYEFNSLLNNKVPKSFSDIEKIDEHFFIGSENDGLAIYKNDLNQLVKRFDYKKGDPKTLSSKSIVKIFFEEKTNEILLATRGSGLFSFSLNDSIFKNYNMDNGLLSNNVNDFLKFKDEIWIQSGNGINFFKEGRLRNINPEDGLKMNSFLKESLHGFDNKILVIGHDNAQVFDPEKIEKNQLNQLQVNLLNITGFDIENVGKIISMTDSIIGLDNNTRSVELNLYTNASNKKDLIQYSYKTSFGGKLLKVENFGNKIKLNSLPFYESEVEIFAQDGNGNVNTNALVIKFFNAPPWWLRIETIIFYIIFSIGLVYSLVKLRESQTKKRMEGERKSKELEEARELQNSLLPKTNPEVEGYQISTYLKSATEIGGDYYDFFYKKDEYFYAVCGDATGHGVISGIMVSVTKAGLNGIPMSSPSKILQQLNRIVKRVNFGRLRMSLSVAKLNKDTIELSSAAMPPTYYFNSNNKKVEEILVPNLPLGGIESEKFEGVKIDFKEGDVVVMISDGLPEQPNPNDELLDYEKVEECVREHSEKDADSIKNALVELSNEWACGVMNPDDITIVVIKKAA